MMWDKWRVVHADRVDALEAKRGRGCSNSRDERVERVVAGAVAPNWMVIGTAGR